MKDGNLFIFIIFLFYLFIYLFFSGGWTFDLLRQPGLKFIYIISGYCNIKFLKVHVKICKGWKVKPPNQWYNVTF